MVQSLLFVGGQGHDMHAFAEAGITRAQTKPLGLSEGMKPAKTNHLMGGIRWKKPAGECRGGYFFFAGTACFAALACCFFWFEVLFFDCF